MTKKLVKPKSTNKYISDFYTHKAKQEGYGARSVYKLQEIHRKHLNFGAMHKVLDVGAAPGSWTQYLQQNLKPDATIISLDITPLSAHLKPLPKVTFIQADITSQETVLELITLGPFDLIISDAAPNTTGNRSIDVAGSEAIVEQIFLLAKQCLKPSGVMVSKIFQGDGFQELFQELKTYFKKVANMKPSAVRSSSFESYLVCREPRSCVSIN